MNTTSNYEQLCDEAQGLHAQGALDDAIRTAHQACGMHPRELRAYLLIGQALTDQGRWGPALETYELAHLLDPDDQAAQTGVRASLAHLRTDPLPDALVRPVQELTAFDFYSKACKRFVRINLMEAAARAAHLAKGEKTNLLVRTVIMDTDAALCDWSRLDEHLAHFKAYAQAQPGAESCSPLLSLSMADDPALHLRIAQQFMADAGGHRAVLGRKLRPTGKLNRRPRIGYLSGDFHDHAVSRLMVGMLEAHDRSAFEVVGLSYGLDDHSKLRQRMIGAFERFVDLREQPADANLKTLRALDLDVVVDATGLTQNYESRYPLSRPAPVLVNFLAYPGSIGSSAYDYVIGDPIVTPMTHQSHFTECIVNLPHTYQCNDPHRPVDPQTPTRSEVGLPENAFVMAAFNNTKKFTPEQFQLWMQLLNQIPRAVLWLVCGNPTAQANLRQCAQQHGVEGQRLVFATTVSLGAHMARHRLADVFIDTFPYNAHTTASDALWMGLPVVTLQGQSFASRVASSLLHAVDAAPLVTHTAKDYVARVVQLAQNPEELAQWRVHLGNVRATSPLFDATRYARNWEQALAYMVDRSRKGKAAHPFEVRDIQAGGGIRLAGSDSYKAVASKGR